MGKKRPPDVPMCAFHAEVVSVIALAPTMRRVVFGGAGLTHFRSTGIGDEYVRVLFPTDPWDRPVLPPILGEELDYGAIDMTRLRTYTVRSFDRGQLTIDFVVHEGGVAAQWARQAQVGQAVAVSSPTGLYDPPAALTWQVLIADLAALPAAARLAQCAPSDVRTRLIVEIPDAASRVDLGVPPGVEVTWIVGGNGRGRSRLDEILSTVPHPGDDGYLWVAGESRTLRAVRAYLRRTLRAPHTAYKAVGYWTAQAECWNERYQALDPEIRAELESLWLSERPVEEIELEYDEQLIRLGL